MTVDEQVEGATIQCTECGPAPLPDGADPFQAAIAHANARKHTVIIRRTDVIRPEEEK